MGEHDQTKSLFEDKKSQDSGSEDKGLEESLRGLPKKYASTYQSDYKDSSVASGEGRQITPPYKKPIIEKITDLFKIVAVVVPILVILILGYNGLIFFSSLSMTQEDIKSLVENTDDIKEAVVTSNSNWLLAQKDVTNIDRQLEKIDGKIDGIRIDLNKTNSEIEALSKYYQSQLRIK